MGREIATGTWDRVGVEAPDGLVMSVGLYRPAADPLYEFTATVDGRPATIAVYSQAEWESIPDGQRPPGIASRCGGAVLCQLRVT
jgi:hypothetical protein